MIVVQPGDGILRAVEGGRVVWEDTALLGFGFEHGSLGLLVWFRGAHGSVERQALLVHELDACHGYVSVEIHAHGVERLVDLSFQIVVHANGNIAHLNHLPLILRAINVYSMSNAHILQRWRKLASGVSIMYGRFWGLHGGVRLSHLRAYVVLLYAFVYNGLCVYNVYKLILR